MTTTTTTATATAPFITLHALQAFPPSLLNRDDANAAKQIVYGDTTRIRVSAQCARRAIRTAMRTHRIEGADYALRTSRFPALTAQVLNTDHNRPLDIATAKTAAVFRALKFKATDKGNTAAMIFASEDFPARLAGLVDEHWDTIGDTPAAAENLDDPTPSEQQTGGGGEDQSAKKSTVPQELVAEASAALDVGRAIDLALFGRMLAEKPSGGRIDGAAGIAHAISVDAAAIEPDWWSAVDDAAPADEPAASNLGMSMVSAPVLYRQASLDRRALRRNLDAAGTQADALAAAGEASFIEWFIRAVPTAKQRSSVAATLPSLVVASSGDQVLSAAHAFTAPVTGTDVIGSASAKLLATLDRAAHALAGALTHHVLCTDPALDTHLGARPHTTSITEFIDTINTH